MSVQVRLKYLDSTVRSEKKRTVESMVSRLVAKWVIYGVIAEMLPPTSGLQRLQNHPLLTHETHDEPQCLSLAGVHSCMFELRGKRTRDTAAGWVAAKWLKEFA